VAVEADELLHAELDRQLAEVRTSCDGLATRSGLLIAAVAAVAAVFAVRVDPKHHLILLIFTAIAFAATILAAFFTIYPGLVVGPVTQELQDWIRTASAPDRATQLFLAKNTILGGNQQRMGIMRTWFLIQGIATIATVVLALCYTALG
jgi:hypothetical protein